MLPLLLSVINCWMTFFLIISLSAVFSLASIHALPRWPCITPPHPHSLDPPPPLSSLKAFGVFWGLVFGVFCCFLVFLVGFFWTAPCCPLLAQSVIDSSVYRPRAESQTWALDHPVSILYFCHLKGRKDNSSFFSLLSPTTLSTCFLIFFYYSFTNMSFSRIYQIAKIGYIGVRLRFVTRTLISL